jgi:hypothetical protein
MGRYSKYVCIILGYCGTTQAHNVISTLKRVHLSAGLYRLQQVRPAHSLVLSSIGGRVPRLVKQIHGKRQYRTAMLRVVLSGSSIYSFLDRFINFIVPHLEDFRTLKVRRVSRLG